MPSVKQEALERLRKALVAYDNDKITGGDLHRVETEVLQVDGVKPQNVRDLKVNYRSAQVKNARA